MSYLCPSVHKFSHATDICIWLLGAQCQCSRGYKNCVVKKFWVFTVSNNVEFISISNWFCHYPIWNECGLRFCCNWFPSIISWMCIMKSLVSHKSPFLFDFQEELWCWMGQVSQVNPRCVWFVSQFPGLLTIKRWNKQQFYRNNNAV